MPKPLSAVDCVSPAFDGTKRQLFSPFRLERWLKLAVLCLITGEIGGGGFGGNFSPPHSAPRHGNSLRAFGRPNWDKIVPWIPWILLGFAAVMAVVLVLIYVASVYRFVLFDSVLYDRCQLKGGWARWEPYGKSYFLWSIALMVVILTGYALLIGGPLLVAWRAGLFDHPRQHLAVLIFGGAALLLVIFVFFVLSAIVHLFAKDFCVPIMAMDNVGVLDAWRRLLPMLAAEKMAFAGYVLMKILLAIASAIIFGITTLIMLVVLAIPLVVAGLIVFFGGRAVGLTFNVATISILAVLGLALALGFLYLVAFINTPPMVFFQLYMIHFIGSRHPSLGAVLFPPPPDSPQPSGFSTMLPSPEIAPTG